MGKKFVIALGGNAIQKAEQVGNIQEQFANSIEACREIAKIVADGHVVALTHGNGPQVGNLLRRVELSQHEIYPLPLDTCVSDTQGGMGYMLQQVMRNVLEKQNLDADVVTVITRCIVDASDPAFKKPTKPIGSFMTPEMAAERAEKFGWVVIEDSGRGWRRVVPSPWPKEIIERRAIKTLMDSGTLVVACGGGGIPVMRNAATGYLVGVEAVIDKDIASALLALEVKADLFVILTGVEQVKVNFRKPDEKSLSTLTVSDAKKYLAEGQFPPGSMGPKIQAAVHCIESGGPDVIITSTDKIHDALNGRTGTRVVKG
ncbi:MAG: carbamate kinase [Candidatus Hydrogenedentota bacterium]